MPQIKTPQDVVTEELPLSAQLEAARKQLEMLTIQVAQQVAAEKAAQREAERGTPEDRLRTLEMFTDHIMLELRNLGGHFHPEWSPPV